MKIAIRGGHTTKSTGAVALLNEVIEDRKVKDATIKYLTSKGHTVKDVTPAETMSFPSELNQGINSANNWGADLFVSIHFNKAYNSYNGTIGTEVCVRNKFDSAQRVVDKISSLGFKNRGQKIRTDLGELNRTNMKAMIIEVCFVEATGDVELYKKIGYDSIGKAIAEGITNSKIESSSNSTSNQNKPTQKKLWELSVSGEVVKELQRSIGVKVDGYFGDDTLKKCPLLKLNSRGNVVKAMQRRLNQLGYNTNGIDGVFGNATSTSIKSLQSKAKISVDGIVGNDTWKALYRK